MIFSKSLSISYPLLPENEFYSTQKSQLPGMSFAWPQEYCLLFWKIQENETSIPAIDGRQKILIIIEWVLQSSCVFYTNPWCCVSLWLYPCTIFYRRDSGTLFCLNIQMVLFDCLLAWDPSLGSKHISFPSVRFGCSHYSSLCFMENGSICQI